MCIDSFPKIVRLAEKAFTTDPPPSGAKNLRVGHASKTLKCLPTIFVCDIFNYNSIWIVEAMGFLKEAAYDHHFQPNTVTDDTIG